jgi:hypothetical protein
LGAGPSIAEGLAERARRELLATGETVRKHTVEAREGLTAQEAQIARLASDGLTNSEIGRAVHQSADGRITPLQGFAKLDVNSSNNLPGALGGHLTGLCRRRSEALGIAARGWQPGVLSQPLLSESLAS